MVARQTAGEQPLRGGMALLRARCIRQSLPQLARELPNDVLESDQPVGQLARRNPEETPRSEHIQVKLLASLLTVMASDRGTIPYPCHERADSAAVDLHSRAQADDQHHADQRALEPPKRRRPLMEVRRPLDNATQRRYRVKLLDHEPHQCRINRAA
jgi:hypothetical protein